MRGAAVGRQSEGPLIAQRIAVHIAGGAAIQADGRAYRGSLVGTGIGHRGTVDRADGDGIRDARQLPVINHELDRVGAWLVDRERRIHRGAIRQDRGAAVGFFGKGPSKSERIAVAVAGGAAVQVDGRAHRGGLIRAGLRHWAQVMTEAPLQQRGAEFDIGRLLNGEGVAADDGGTGRHMAEREIAVDHHDTGIAADEPRTDAVRVHRGGRGEACPIGMLEEILPAVDLFADFLVRTDGEAGR